MSRTTEITDAMQANAAFKTVADTAKAAAAIGAPLQPVLVTLLMPSIIAVALAYDTLARSPRASGRWPMKST